MSPGQMIYIPKKIGVSHLVMDQKRVIYINDFSFEKFSLDFMQGADNPTAIKKIQNFVSAPLFNVQGQVCGLLYFYNSSTGTINMNCIKKMRAMTKLLGGCISLVEITAEALLVKVGLQSRLDVL